jgi:cyanophycinase
MNAGYTPARTEESLRVMKRIQLIFFVLFCAALAVRGASRTCRAEDAPYKYFRTGIAADAPAKNLQGGFALIGGGKDLDEAFAWMCGRSGGGDFLIVRASGTDAYNPYVNSLCKQNSVATLIIPTREAALSPAAAQTIHHAEAIFIAGGDQSNYINFWTDTPVQAALNEAIGRGVPIGGTSAGLAVLGEFVYSAQNDLPNGPNLTSAAALANPFHNQITITKNFLQIAPLRPVITDSHFSSRDRLGRTLAFLARILQEGDLKFARGIGIDEHTAVLVQPDGAATIAGSGAAYFFEAATRASLIEAGTPLSIENITVSKLTAGGAFDLKRWPNAAIHYTLSVQNGQVHSTQPGGAIY